MRADIGMVFQENALFDSLTVGENVGYRLYEETRLPLDEVRARVEEVLAFLGLASSSIACRRACPAASGAASASAARWPRSRT
jgi:ABC-type transporter Mla maintaining outer membrane lipid asymmetry ATPase subunit MlaF